MNFVNTLSSVKKVGLQIGLPSVSLITEPYISGYAETGDLITFVASSTLVFLSATTNSQVADFYDSSAMTGSVMYRIVAPYATSYSVVLIFTTGVFTGIATYPSSLKYYYNFAKQSPTDTAGYNYVTNSYDMSFNGVYLDTFEDKTAAIFENSATAETSFAVPTNGYTMILDLQMYPPQYYDETNFLDASYNFAPNLYFREVAMDYYGFSGVKQSPGVGTAARNVNRKTKILFDMNKFNFEFGAYSSYEFPFTDVSGANSLYNFSSSNSGRYLMSNVSSYNNIQTTIVVIPYSFLAGQGATNDNNRFHVKNNVVFNPPWYTTKFSGNCKYCIMVGAGGAMYSTDEGYTFNSIDILYGISCVYCAISDDGKYSYITATSQPGGIWRSSDYMKTWSLAFSTTDVCRSVEVSRTGKYVLCLTVNNRALSTDYGNTFTLTPITSGYGTYALYVSPCGKYMAYGENVESDINVSTGGFIYKSTDYGTTFNVLDQGTNKLYSTTHLANLGNSNWGSTGGKEKWMNFKTIGTGKMFMLNAYDRSSTYQYVVIKDISYNHLYQSPANAACGAGTNPVNYSYTGTVLCPLASDTSGAYQTSYIMYYDTPQYGNLVTLQSTTTNNVLSSVNISSECNLLGTNEYTKLFEPYEKNLLYINHLPDGTKTYYNNGKLIHITNETYPTDSNVKLKLSDNKMYGNINSIRIYDGNTNFTRTQIEDDYNNKPIEGSVTGGYIDVVTDLSMIIYSINMFFKVNNTNLNQTILSSSNMSLVYNVTGNKRVTYTLGGVSITPTDTVEPNLWYFIGIHRRNPVIPMNTDIYIGSGLVINRSIANNTTQTQTLNFSGLRIMSNSFSGKVSSLRITNLQILPGSNVHKFDRNLYASSTYMNAKLSYFDPSNCPILFKTNDKTNWNINRGYNSQITFNPIGVIYDSNDSPFVNKKNVVTLVNSGIPTIVIFFVNGKIGNWVTGNYVQNYTFYSNSSPRTYITTKRIGEHMCGYFDSTKNEYIELPAINSNKFCIAIRYRVTNINNTTDKNVLLEYRNGSDYVCLYTTGVDVFSNVPNSIKYPMYRMYSFNIEYNIAGVKTTAALSGNLNPCFQLFTFEVYSPNDISYNVFLQHSNISSSLPSTNALSYFSPLLTSLPMSYPTVYIGGTQIPGYKSFDGFISEYRQYNSNTIRANVAFTNINRPKTEENLIAY